MGFFGDLKQDLSQAVNELLPDENKSAVPVTPAEPEQTPSPKEISLGDMLDNIDAYTLPAENEESFETETKEADADNFLTESGLKGVNLESMLDEISRKAELAEQQEISKAPEPKTKKKWDEFDEEALLNELFTVGKPSVEKEKLWDDGTRGADSGIKESVWDLKTDDTVKKENIALPGKKVIPKTTIASPERVADDKAFEEFLSKGLMSERAEPAKEPTSAEEPIMPEEPVAEEEPAAEEPIAEEEPVAEEPIVVEGPVIPEEPIAAEGPIIPEEPIVVEEPVMSEEPVAEEEPAAEKTIIPEEPVVAEEPAVSEGPVLEEPVLEEPVSVVEDSSEAAEEGSEENTVLEEPVLEKKIAMEESILKEPVMDEALAVKAAMEQLVSGFPEQEEEVIDLDIGEFMDQAAVETSEEVSEPVQEENAIVRQEESAINDEEGEMKMDSFAENAVAVDETSVITAGMTVTGDVSSKGSVDIVGEVNGNIRILGKLNVTGYILGNSQAGEVFAEGAKITGDIVSEGSVKVGASTVIIGNITAISAAIAGAVKGDIDVRGPVVLDASAIVMGNIKSKSVQINNGAVIEGMCSQCYADVSPTSFFDEYKTETKRSKAAK